MKLFNRRLVLISVITCATLFGTSISTFAASELTLTKDIEVNDINEIKLDAHVGTVKLSKSRSNAVSIMFVDSEKIVLHDLHCSMKLSILSHVPNNK